MSGQIKIARRYIARGVTELTHAASILRAAGYEQEARQVSNAAYEAATADAEWGEPDVNVTPTKAPPHGS